MFRLYRKHLHTLCLLLAGVWLFAIFVGVVGCCLYSTSLPEMSSSQHIHAVVQQSEHEHCDGDHAPIAQHDDASCQLEHDHNLAGLLKFIQSDVSKIGALALIAVLIVHLALIAAPQPASIRLGFALTFTGDPPPTIRFHRFNN